jgi:hypothetical protein
MPPHTFTGRHRAPNTDSVTVLLLDALNASAADALTMRTKIIRTVAKLPPGGRIAGTQSSWIRQRGQGGVELWKKSDSRGTGPFVRWNEGGGPHPCMTHRERIRGVAGPRQNPS